MNFAEMGLAFVFCGLAGAGLSICVGALIDVWRRRRL